MTCGTPVVSAIQSGVIGYLTSPNSFQLPKGDDVYWALDNGCFSESAAAMDINPNSTERGVAFDAKPDNFNETKWLGIMDKYNDFKDNCLFVNAPDVFADWDATVTRSMPYLDIIRARGYSPAITAQPGATPANIPWDDIDALFIGGPDEFRWRDAFGLAREANNRGKWVHLGRCNSGKRLRWAETIGCHSADGTAGTFYEHLPLIHHWTRTIRTQRPLFDLAGEHGGPT